MAIDSGQDWRAQLEQLRGSVEEMEQRRAEEERLKLKRNREGLQERLRKDTPETIPQQLQELRKECDRSARRFYPLQAIEEACQMLRDFDKRMQFYKGCEKEFGDLFSPRLKQAISKCQGDIANAMRGLERQLKQWHEIRDVLAEISFRAKKDADDKGLAQVAKDFSQTAHQMGLTIPPDFFAAEDQGFHAVTHQDEIIGHIKYWEGRNVITFALTSPVKLNFPKFVRGVLFKAYREGPLAEKNQTTVRARLTMAKEVRFFTDLGFVRSETVSVSEWVYERPLD